MVMYAIITTSALVFLFMSFKNLKDSFEEIAVKRINIVDEKGTNRIVISNQERIPNPIIAGKEYKRRIAPAGLIFYDEKGDEVGGLAFSSTEDSGLRALALDYENADAIGMIAQEDLKSDYFRAGILINDKDLSRKPGINISRMSLMTENGNAGLIINGPDEKPRVQIMVDSLGNPSINLLDAEGNITKEIK